MNRAGRSLLALVVGVALLPASVAAAAPAQPAPTCAPGEMPYAGLPGASLTPETHVSVDADPVHYVRWRGTVPGYDGMPFSVDVTVPCGAEGPQPTVVMAHGFTDDKTVWEETGKSDSVDSEERPATNSRWNNIWFASRGYTVVNYTARGWRDSCGPETPGANARTPAPQCLPFEYWIHLDDMRWEVRDAQWLAGALVQSDHADPERVAITGGSYGGGPAAMGALLADTTMCGGAPVPEALGPDPCPDAADGELVPWTTPDGDQPMSWAASLPLYTFGDLIQVLAPNGRSTDGWELAPPHGDPTQPFGVPIHSTVTGLLAAGTQSGFFAPPGVDPDADIYADASRLIAGNPFLPQDPLVARGAPLYRTFKSPIGIAPQGRVPMFWVHGFTDPLFPALEPLTVRNAVLEADPDYPFKLFLGDIGHDYSGERQDEWDLVKAQMNDFLDHHLRPDRSPAPPAFDVGATVTRCLEKDAPVRYVAAPDWHDLHPHHIRFTSDAGGVTSTAVPGPAALATDPISTATLPLPGSYKGCRIMRPSEPDPTVATFEFAVADDLVLMGGPVIEVDVTTTGPDVPLSARLWHVAPDGSEQGLVTRGTYRIADAGPAELAFQLGPQGYRFPAGHRIKLELTANDSPYYQASNIPAAVTVGTVDLVLPLLEAPTSAQPAPEPPTRSSGPGGGAATLPATGGSVPVVLVAALLAAAIAARSGSRRVRS
jgi:predicted acyl esterase